MFVCLSASVCVYPMRLAIPLLNAATVPFSYERSRVGSDDENFPHVGVTHPRNIGGRCEAGSVGMGEGKEEDQGGWEGRNGWGEREHIAGSGRWEEAGSAGMSSTWREDIARSGR